MTDLGGIRDAGYGRQFADFYDRLFPGGPAVAQTVRRLADLHPGDGAATLELGVGTGRIALPLAELVGPVVGVDSSPEMLAVLTSTMAAAGHAAPPVSGAVPAADGSVATVDDGPVSIADRIRMLSAQPEEEADEAAETAEAVEEITEAAAEVKETVEAAEEAKETVEAAAEEATEKVPEETKE